MGRGVTHRQTQAERGRARPRGESDGSGGGRERGSLLAGTRPRPGTAHGPRGASAASFSHSRACRVTCYLWRVTHVHGELLLLFSRFRSHVTNLKEKERQEGRKRGRE